MLMGQVTASLQGAGEEQVRETAEVSGARRPERDREPRGHDGRGGEATARGPGCAAPAGTAQGSTPALTPATRGSACLVPPFLTHSPSSPPIWRPSVCSL